MRGLRRGLTTGTCAAAAAKGRPWPFFPAGRSNAPSCGCPRGKSPTRAGASACPWSRSGSERRGPGFGPQGRRRRRRRDERNRDTGPCPHRSRRAVVGGREGPRLRHREGRQGRGHRRAPRPARGRGAAGYKSRAPGHDRAGALPPGGPGEISRPAGPGPGAGGDHRGPGRGKAVAARTWNPRIGVRAAYRS